MPVACAKREWRGKIGAPLNEISLERSFVAVVRVPRTSVHVTPSPKTKGSLLLVNIYCAQTDTPFR
jgi:hypothetical protein